jgi:hypothetical protein
MLAIKIPFYILMLWLCVSAVNFCPIANFFSASRRRCLLSVQVGGAGSGGKSSSRSIDLPN